MNDDSCMVARSIWNSSCPASKPSTSMWLASTSRLMRLNSGPGSGHLSLTVPQRQKGGSLASLGYSKCSLTGLPLPRVLVTSHNAFFYMNSGSPLCPKQQNTKIKEHTAAPLVRRRYISTAICIAEPTQRRADSFTMLLRACRPFKLPEEPWRLS